MLVDLKTAIPGRRYQIRSGAAAAVTDGATATSRIIHRLPAHTIVVGAEVLIDERGDQRVRISSPAGWLRADDLEPAAAAPSLKLEFATFKARHLQVAAGDRYGLAFPFTFDLLREFGPDFLTAAFRAAGTISDDNQVTAIVELQPLGIMGASENAFLTLAYAKSEPGLQTKLFVKFPPAGLEHKYALAPMSHGEVEIMRLSREKQLPVPVAKYYFGDYCSHTSNYILITERIRFGVAPIEPAYRKGRDHLVPEVEDHYRVLVKALAKLVAAHKTGRLGYELERSFPFARAARDFEPIPAAEVKVDRLIDFIGRVAPHLFIATATEPAFLRQWRDDVLFGLAHNDAVVAYLHANVDYTGLCHSNLNVDNAWYWRDASGALQVGLLDWGGMGQMSIAQALSSMLMMPDPERYSGLVRMVIATFVSEYAQQGGVALDPDELLLQYKASVFSTAMWIIVSIVTDALSRFTEDDYKTMPDRFDSRLQESGMCSAIVWIDNMLREWLDAVTPGEVCRRIVAQHR